MHPMDDRIQKLPKWARHKIEQLTSDLKSAEKKLAAMEAGETNVWLENFGVTPNTHLPSDSRVIFQDAKGRRIEVSLTAGKIMVSTHRGVRLTIRPVAANCVYVEEEGG